MKPGMLPPYLAKRAAGGDTKGDTEGDTELPAAIEQGPPVVVESKLLAQERRRKLLALTEQLLVRAGAEGRGWEVDVGARVPKDPVENLLWKRAVYRDERPSFQRAVWERCKSDVVWYIDGFVWQFNPKKRNDEVGPMISWDFQEQMLNAPASRTAEGHRRAGIRHCMEAQEDLCMEKSREIGGSWFVLMAFDHDARFWPHRDYLAISHSLDAVWKPKDPKSLFWKVKFMHSMLPLWLGSPEFAKLVFHYPDTGSVFSGTSTTERSGVSGRASSILLDEFALQPDAEKIMANTAAVSDCRIFVSTHYGLGTAFYGITVNPEVNKLVIHWSNHPGKRQGLYRYDPLCPTVPEVLDKGYEFPAGYKFDLSGKPLGGPFPGLRSVWYDRERSRPGMDDRTMSSHQDINPVGSTHTAFDEAVVRKLITQARPPVWEGMVLAATGREEARLVAGGDRKLRMWERPDSRGLPPRSRYAIGADIANGTGATPTCFSVVDCYSGLKVAEYADATLKYQDAAALAVQIGQIFRDELERPAQWIWECPGNGIEFGKELVNVHRYRNVYEDEEQLKKDAVFRQKGIKWGWWNKVDTKRVLMHEFGISLASGRFVNYSKPALEELLKFEYKGSGNRIEHAAEAVRGNPSGASVNHGDMGMADALADLARRKMALPPTRPAPAVADAHPFMSVGWMMRRDAENRDAEREREWGD